jgi:hypothetical protein
MILPTGSDKGTESSVATKVKLVTLNELEDEWTRQSDAPFSISVAIEMALGSSGEEGTFIQLLDETDSEDADHDTQAVLPGAAIKAKGKKKKSMAQLAQENAATVYVTDQELRRVWARSSEGAMGRSIDKFNTLEALLLLDGRRDTALFGAGSTAESGSITSPSPDKALIQEDKENSEDPDVLFIRSADLQKTWEMRAEVQWGLPNADYDEHLALLLLDEDEDEEYPFQLREDDSVMEEDGDADAMVDFDLPYSTAPVEENGDDLADIHDIGKTAVAIDFDSAGENSLDVGNSVNEDENKDGSVGVGTKATGAQLSAFRARRGLEYVRASEAELPEERGEGVWDLPEHKGRARQVRRDALKQITRELESMHAMEDRVAWKKDRHILTPDIDTQTFYGDLMWSNTYMTQRVPANWDDPEADEMSDTYLSAGSMAWEGEEETDFNAQLACLQKPWAVLGLPEQAFPEHVQRKELAVPGTADALDEGGDDGPIDWNTFDFASEFGEESTGASSAGDGVDVDSIDSPEMPANAGSIDMDMDVDSFFAELEGKPAPSTSELASSAVATATAAAAAAALTTPEQSGSAADQAENPVLSGGEMSASGFAGAPPPVEDLPYDLLEKEAVEMVAGKTYESLSPKVKKWVTPLAWLEQAQWADHVGYDEWSLYGTSEQWRTEGLSSPPVFANSAETTEEQSDNDENALLFDDSADDFFLDADDMVCPDDIRAAVTYAHILHITDWYLTDHVAIAQELEDSRVWERRLAAGLRGDPSLLKEPVPAHLTPDADRGIEYSDDIIEMKGKISLHAQMGSPADEFSADEFDYNTENVPLNNVGTVREQYSWTPDDAETQAGYRVDEAVVSEIRPVLDFANQAAELLSTRDGVLIFNYKGNMRQLLGIRDMMLSIAKDCYPGLKDLRLVTERTHDKYDS